tara:strand:+ start:201 stop:845 length:645 start_codon:yes stop_codon:yes gene_type:complete
MNQDELDSILANPQIKNLLTLMGGALDPAGQIRESFPDRSMEGAFEFEGLSPQDLQNTMNTNDNFGGQGLGEAIPREREYPLAGQPDSFNGLMRFIADGLETPVNTARDVGMGGGVLGILGAAKKHGLKLAKGLGDRGSVGKNPGNNTDKIQAAKGNLSIIANPSADFQAKQKAIKALEVEKDISNIALGQLDGESRKVTIRALNNARNSNGKN